MDVVNITESQVMREPNGISKGSGFVAFSAPDEAARAVSFPNFMCLGKW